ncbi:MAG: histidine--tRNA ligase [archaeon]|jgi:histidyl-tRNA synthetase
MGLSNVRGMRDLIGKDALLQKKVENAFENVFTKYGYNPLYTPAVENFDLFKVKGAAGDAIKEEIYYFKDKSERELGLRFEFTASLARIAATQQLRLPYKRYQIGEVYRYDRPQAKRYRAFNQADIDILGISDLSAEIEVMKVIRDCFNSLKLKPRVIFNSRKLLNDLFNKFASGKEVEAMRILDKIDKIGKEAVIEMLNEENIDTSVVDIILENDIKKITQVLGQSGGVKEINEFLEKCKESNLDFVEFNASLARGFDYYTGIVFEIKLDTGPSVGGGGRYDKLVKTYGGSDTPAVGIGLGVSRIFDYLKENNAKNVINGMFLVNLSKDTKKVNDFASSLREKDVICELDLKKFKLAKAFEYADNKGYRIVGILGDNELAENKITIKNLINGMQFQVEMNADKIKELLTK